MPNPPSSDYVRKIMRQFDLGAPSTIIVKLPCGHESKEVIRLEDQIVQCGICLKRALLVWSKREGAMKWK